MFAGFALLGALPLRAQTAPVTANGATPQAAAPPAGPLAPRGSVELKWFGRWTGDDHDNDLHSYANVTFGDANKESVTAAASGRGVWDLDRASDPTHPFRSVEDTRDNDVVGYLYTAYADMNGVADGVLPRALRRVRLGRQVFYETPQTLFLDGASVESAPIEGLADLVLSGWVGVPVHFYESSRRGDVAAGGAASLVPWLDGRLRVDFMHVSDEYLSTENDDDLLGFRLDQRLWQHVDADVHVNVLDGDARDMSAAATWSPPDADLSLTGRYVSLLTNQTTQSIEFDYFTPLLQTFYAYHQFELSGHKGLGDVFGLDAGAQVRELRDDANEGTFNHEFRRYWVSPGIAEWPWSGLDASVTYEFWDAGGERFTAAGADVTQKLDERWRVSVGTLFELFRYDVLLGQEREDVQVSYAKLRYRASDHLTLDARFEFEDGQTADFIGGTIGARIDF